MCGEKPNCFFWLATHWGSPPRVRGKGDRKMSWQVRDGITPACAGKRISGRFRAPAKRDHPRVCGEKLSMLNEGERQTGSPPRVRGKGHLAPVLSIRQRITPACAGKRLRQISSASKNRDHPRVCGEKVCRARSIKLRKGSPPRVRGKASPFRGLSALYGITPACAGKRETSKCRDCRSKDHPRVCGEKSKNCQQ